MSAEPFVLRLDWCCTRCGWHIEMDAPAFAGDGTYHYPLADSPGGGQHQCGPLIARYVPESADSQPEETTISDPTGSPRRRPRLPVSAKNGTLRAKLTTPLDAPTEYDLTGREGE